MHGDDVEADLRAEEVLVFAEESLTEAFGTGLGKVRVDYLEDGLIVLLTDVFEEILEKRCLHEIAIFNQKKNESK